MKQECVFLILAFGAAGFAQQSAPVPIYRVTVTERTVKAINYQYRSGPTLIDFRGTVLMPKAKGTASVESKPGRCEVDVRFENLAAPAQFGREYLTYVLWALTPDGRPHNIGEVVANGSDKARLRVTTDYQAFAMIVTAEPYSAVRAPSDVVVLENQVRPDTAGKIEQVEARYELMPRGHYAWQIPEKLSSEAAEAPKVSMHKYEELLELYQAQNAVGIARSQNAGQYAPNTFAKADRLLTQARQLEQSKADSATVIQTAREAAQTAEDARVIADRRRQEDELARARADVASAEQARAQAAAELDRAKAEAEAARSEAEAAKARADTDRASRERAEAQAEASRAAQAEAAAARPSTATLPQVQRQERQSEARMRLLEQLNGPLATRDTPRGLVAIVPATSFSGSALRSDAAGQIARLGAIVAAHPGLRVEVEGHAATQSEDQLSWKRAEAVRDAMIRRGLSPNAITSRGLGSTRPLVSNTTAAGREQNDRVEIVISGDPIGSLPFWDRTYALRQ